MAGARLGHFERNGDATAGIIRGAGVGIIEHTEANECFRVERRRTRGAQQKGA